MDHVTLAGMARLRKLGNGVLIAAAASALALPPPAFALATAWTDDEGNAKVSAFELEIWANATRALTSAELLEARLHALAVADDTFTAAANVLTANGHGLLTGDGPLYLSTVADDKAELDLDTVTGDVDTIIEATSAGAAGNAITIAFVADGTGAGSFTRVGSAFTFHYQSGVTTVTNFETAVAALAGADDLIAVKTPGTGSNTFDDPADTLAATPLAGGADAELPAGLEADTPYYAVRLDANTISVAISRELALAGTVVEVTDGGVGVHTWSDSADTERVHWHSLGLLGPAGDGAISLTDQRAYATRRDHSPRAIAYAVAATFGAGTGVVSARVYPLAEA